MTEELLLVAAMPLAVAIAVVCLRNPMHVALPIFAALIPYGSALSVLPSRFGSLSSLAGLMLAGGLVLQLVTTRRGAARLSPSVPIWLLFLGVAAASILWTMDRDTTASGIAVLGSLVLVYVFTTFARVDRKAVRNTENGLLVGGVSVVCYGLYQRIFLGGFPSDVPGEGIVPDGRFGNDLLGPSLQAVALLLPLAIALTRAFAETRRVPRLSYAVMAALMFAGVLMTGSRTGTLAMGLALLVLAWCSPRQARTGLLACFGVALAVAALVWLYHPAGIAARTFDTATSSSGRTDIWRVGLAACTDYCPYGSGWGTYPQVYAETQASVPGARVLVGDEGSYQPHNLWLLAAVELGVPGLVLLALGLGFALLEALRLPHGLRGPPLSAVAGLLVAVFFLSSMEFKFFWMVLIMVAMYRNLADSETEGVEPSAGTLTSSGRSPRPAPPSTSV